MLKEYLYPFPEKKLSIATMLVFKIRYITVNTLEPYNKKKGVKI